MADICVNATVFFQRSLAVSELNATLLSSKFYYSYKIPTSGLLTFALQCSLVGHRLATHVAYGRVTERDQHELVVVAYQLSTSIAIALETRRDKEDDYVMHVQLYSQNFMSSKSVSLLHKLR